MLGQQHLPEPPLAQFSHHFILPETAGRIEILAIGGIQNSLTLDKFEIILKIFGAFRVEQPKMRVVEHFLNIFKAFPSLTDLEFMRF